MAATFNRSFDMREDLQPGSHHTVQSVYGYLRDVAGLPVTRWVETPPYFYVGRGRIQALWANDVMYVSWEDTPTAAPFSDGRRTATQVLEDRGGRTHLSLYISANLWRPEHTDSLLAYLQNSGMPVVGIQWPSDQLGHWVILSDFIQQVVLATSLGEARCAYDISRHEVLVSWAPPRTYTLGQNTTHEDFQVLGVDGIVTPAIHWVSPEELLAGASIAAATRPPPDEADRPVFVLNRRVRLRRDL